MTPDELLRNEAAKWLRQAAKDRNAAQVLLEVEPSRSVFHSQQAAEKETHNLTDLTSRMQAKQRRL